MNVTTYFIHLNGRIVESTTDTTRAETLSQEGHTVTAITEGVSA